MAYSELGIANLMLMRIGVARITLADWTTPVTPQSEDANACWEYIRDEVLEAKEWRFAKTRVALERASVAPLYGFNYAYIMPEGFLKFAKGDKLDPAIYSLWNKYPYKVETIQLPLGAEKVTNGTFTGAATNWTLGAQWTYGANAVSKAVGGVTTLSQIHTSMVSVPVVGEMYLLEFEITAIDGGFITPKVGGAEGTPVSDIRVHQQYIVATSAIDGITFTPSANAMTCTIDNVSLFKVTDKLCLLTDYEDSEANPLYINYIKKVTDPTKYSPSFINALAWRLGKELSLNRTESVNKTALCETEYNKALTRAEGFTQSLDSLEDEQGNSDWEDAGR